MGGARWAPIVSSCIRNRSRARSRGATREARESFAAYARAAELAHALGLGVNAGHDLDLDNLVLFRRLPHLDEVSIGHALVSHALFVGLAQSVRDFLDVLMRIDRASERLPGLLPRSTPRCPIAFRLRGHQSPHEIRSIVFAIAGCASASSSAGLLGRSRPAGEVQPRRSCSLDGGRTCSVRHAAAGQPPAAAARRGARSRAC